MVLGCMRGVAQQVVHHPGGGVRWELLMVCFPIWLYVPTCPNVGGVIDICFVVGYDWIGAPIVVGLSGWGDWCCTKMVGGDVVVWVLCWSQVAVLLLGSFSFRGCYREYWRRVAAWDVGY